MSLNVTKPTDSQLSAVDSAADLSERQDAARAARRNAYGDLVVSSTCSTTMQSIVPTAWKDHVAKVKSDNPDPYRIRRIKNMAYVGKALNGSVSNFR